MSDADVPPTSPARRTIGGGRYELLSAVGRGSIGAVHRARQTVTGAVVAVKVLHEALQRDEAFCRRFREEALAIGQLDHPNVVQVPDFGQDADGTLFLAMPLLDGVSLRALLERERPLDVARVVALTIQVCAGLAHAHARGVLHRRLTPENVMVLTREDDDGLPVETVKLLDLGFSEPAGLSREAADRLAPSPLYMTPEECRGEALDARSDVYAVGLLLFELATGTPPFRAPDADALRAMHLGTPPPRVAARRAGLDPRLDAIVQRCLAKARDARHATIQELRADLKALLTPRASAPSLAPLAPPIPSVAPTPRASAPSLPPLAPSAAPTPRASAPSLPPMPMPSRLPSAPSLPPLASLPSIPPLAYPSMPPASPSMAPRPVTPSMLPSVEPPPSVRPGSSPGLASWLEIGSRIYDGHLDGTAAASAMAEMLAGGPTTWLAELSRERDPRIFVRRMEDLHGAVRVLAQRADAPTLRRVSVVVGGLAGQTPPSDACTKALASVAKLFVDPDVLTPVALRLLVEADATSEPATELLLRARSSGAVALYHARVRLANGARDVAPATIQRARIAFVTTMRALGAAAVPVLRAALERVRDHATSGQHRSAVELAEDLLLGVPRAEDEAMGTLVASYAASRAPTVCRAVARALPRVWGARARPTLAELAAHPDDDVRVAAAAALGELDVARLR